jgi:hypothetical protein
MREEDPLAEGGLLLHLISLTPEPRPGDKVGPRVSAQDFSTSGA